MKFCEAMEKLKNGSKVSRNPWKEGLYFLLVDDEIKSFQPKLKHFMYDENIMMSEGWFVDDKKDSLKFCEIVNYLKNGSVAKKSDWKNCFIYLDKLEKVLVLSYMDIFPFVPQFNDFLAEDWIELQ